MRPVNLALSVLSNRMGAVPRPSWCTYLVCYHCNARCKMCDSWRMKRGYEMSPAQVREVFAKIGRLDVVRLTGGEPFLRQDMAEVAQAVMAASEPKVLHLTSNGSFPDRVEDFARNFSDPSRLRFMISFDGAEAEHNANRGVEVTFATAFETVERLAALRHLGLAVSINHTVISEQSLEDHASLLDRFEKIGVDVHAVLAYSDSAMYGAKRKGKKAEDLISLTGYPLHPALAEADTVSFVRAQLGDLDRAVSDPTLRIGKRYYLRGLLARLQNDPDPMPRPKCVALRSHIRLLPDGSVPVCQFNTEPVGNLLKDSFADVWHGVKATESRQWVDACPGCWAECEVMPSAIYSGDMLRHWM